MLELEALVERPRVLDFQPWFKSPSDIVLASVSLATFSLSL